MNQSLRRWVWPSKAVSNMRDLGGYVCDSGHTRFGVVLRSDQLFGLTEDEKDQLVQRGLTDVIDLRSDGERDRFPNDFKDHPSVKIHTVKLDHSKDEFQFLPQDFTCMGGMYIKMTDANGVHYARMVGVVAEAEGMCIVHCMAGKDRTGIVCALILLLLGVDERDVVADYQISETHQNYKNLGAYATENPDMPRYLMESPAENMRMLIRHLNETYGGAEAYVKKHGLTDEQIQKLRDRMIERFN